MFLRGFTPVTDEVFSRDLWDLEEIWKLLLKIASSGVFPAVTSLKRSSSISTRFVNFEKNYIFFQTSYHKARTAKNHTIMIRKRERLFISDGCENWYFVTIMHLFLNHFNFWEYLSVFVCVFVFVLGSAFVSHLRNVKLLFVLLLLLSLSIFWLWKQAFVGSCLRVCYFDVTRLNHFVNISKR